MPLTISSHHISADRAPQGAVHATSCRRLPLLLPPLPAAMAGSQQPRAWRNTYWLLRHGRSTANERDLIVARLVNGERPEWGLTAEGRQQAAAAGEQLRALLGATPANAGSAHDGSGVNGGSGAGKACTPGTLHFLASPFSRAMETAQAASQALGTCYGTLQLQVRWVQARQMFAARAAGWAGLQWASMAGHIPAHMLLLPTLLACRPCCPLAQVEPALRERNFGDYEMSSCSNYHAVWAEDAKSTANRCAAAHGLVNG